MQCKVNGADKQYRIHAGDQTCDLLHRSGDGGDDYVPTWVLSVI